MITLNAVVLCLYPMSLSCCRFYPACLLAAYVFGAASFAQEPDLQIVTESSPPYQTLLNGEVAGEATDKVKAIIQRAGLTASYSMFPWARAYKKALTEPNTLIYALAKTEQRDALFTWLSPVTQYEFGLVKLSGREDIQLTSIDQIKTYRLAVQRDDISHQWMVRNGLIEGEHFITCSDINCSWQLLLNKNVDLIIETAELIEDMLRQNGKSSGSAEFIMPIPELAITGYLATNHLIAPDLLKKLQQAIAAQP